MSLEPLIPNRLDDENSTLVVLDQTLLPNEVKYLSLRTNAEICHAIKTLQVRGAPAIGVAAGYGAYLAAKSAPETTRAPWAIALATTSDTAPYCSMSAIGTPKISFFDSLLYDTTPHWK